MSLTKRVRRIFENVSPIPKASPVKFNTPEPLHIRVRRLVQSEQLRQYAMSQGVETFEESEDFDIPDDPVDPTIPWETTFDPELGREITNAQKAILDEERQMASREITPEVVQKRFFKKKSKPKAKVAEEDKIDSEADAEL